MTPPTTAPGPQPQPPRQASALLEVAIAAAPMPAAATRAVKSFRIVSTSIHDGFCRPTQGERTLHIDWLIPTERLFPRMWISSGKTAGRWRRKSVCAIQVPRQSCLRTSCGSLAILAAIRRARRSFHRRLSTRGCGTSLLEVGALELAIQMPW